MSNTRNLRRQCLTSFLELDEESHHLSPKYVVKKTAPERAPVDHHYTGHPQMRKCIFANVNQMRCTIA